MTSPLIRRQTDPNRRGRGAGEYYKRGGYKKGWYSKYSEKRDAAKKSSQTKSPYVSNRYRHTGDGYKGKKI